MKRTDAILSVVVLAVIGLLAYFWFAPDGVQRAPDVRMVTTTNQHLRLSEWRGHPVLVNFWATTCPSCVEEIPHLKALYNELGPKGLKIIGVSMYYDPPMRVMRMMKRRDIAYPVVNDVDQHIIRAFGMHPMVTPTSYLIDPHGRIVQHITGMIQMSKLRPRIERMLAPAPM